MIYQDLHGVFYIRQDNSNYLLRFTYESIKTHIEVHHLEGNYSHIRYCYIDGILYYADRGTT